ncbi:MAG: DUF3173 family protein [Oscillospiraceae bacterium]|nr:DUF3173 family protein [Oscillospiraceae bacterium]
MARVPRINADTMTLFRLYYQYETVSSKDLQEVFGFSRSKCAYIIRYVREYMAEKGMKPYAPPTVVIVPTNILFEVYGWDIEQITRKARVLQKNGLAG